MLDDMFNSVLLQLCHDLVVLYCLLKVYCSIVVFYG